MRKFFFLLVFFCLPLQAVDYAALPALQNPVASQRHLLAIANAGSRIVAVGERGVIIYSDDGGKHWQQARVPVSQTLTALSFVGQDHGWAVGHGGVILHTGDGGESWQLQFDGNEVNRQWLAYTRQQLPVLQQELAVASPAQRPELEYQLEDAGYAIEDAELAVATGPADPFLDVLFYSPQQGIAVGAYGMIYRTDNGGLQWYLAVTGVDNPDRFHFYKLAYSDSGQLYLSGEAGIIYRSDDRGDSWEKLPLNYDGSLFTVLALPDDVLLCSGLRGNIFRSEDRGESWLPVNDSSNNMGFSLFAGSRLPGGSIVLVGAGGVLASSNDGGRQFSSDIHNSRDAFTGIIQVGEDLLLTGMSGVHRIVAARGQR